MGKDTVAIILRESTAIMDAQSLFFYPVEELHDEDAVSAWSVLDVLEKELMKKRKEELRQSLFKRAENKGTKNPKGSFVLDLGDEGKFTKERRAGKTGILKEKFLERFAGDRDVEQIALSRRVELSELECQWLFSTLQKFESSVAGRIATKIEQSEVSISDDRVETLVNTGVISLEELKEVTFEADPTWALRVGKPKVVKELLKKVKGK